MIKAKFAVLSTLFVLAAVNFCGAQSADFYVSPTGSDKNPGTLDKPLATLSKARDAVRELLPKQDRDIVVMLRGGEYSLSKTTVFGLSDSGKAPHKVIYKNFPGEEPILTSGIKITGWKKLEADLPGLPDNAKGEIWIADVPENLKRFCTLYDGDQTLPRALSAVFKPTKKFTDWRGDEPEDRRNLSFPKGVLKNWPNLEDVEIVGVPIQNWTMVRLPLKSVNETTLIATTAIDSPYGLGDQNKPGSFVNGCFWVENVPEALDEPGEWIFNSKTRKLYLWPKAGKPSDNIIAPLLKQFILVEGKIDLDGPADIPVKNIVFQGLSLTCGKRHSWVKNYAHIQHSWESYDTANALIRFRGAEHCAVKECRFMNSGAGAVRLDLHCQNNTVENNLIEYIGGSGIVLCGYGPGTKNVSKYNTVFNNCIHHTGQQYWHSPGIIICQSEENLVKNNLIHHTPYNGLVLTGPRVISKASVEYARTFRWKELGGEKEFPETLPYIHCRNNRVEYNEVHHTMLALGDGNGIYMSGTGTGNRIMRNYVHHVIGNKDTHVSTALRTDMHQRGTIINENIVYQCAKGGVTLKDINQFENNIIACLLLPDDPENVSHTNIEGYIRFRGGPLVGATVKRNICYHRGDPRPLYSIGRMPHLPEYNIGDADVDYNTFYTAQNPQYARDYLEEIRNKEKPIPTASVLIRCLLIWKTATSC
ncbi:right-handed parallel beta-helix repeat-containing protein [Planctomycetota bacterium]